MVDHCASARRARAIVMGLIALSLFVGCEAGTPVPSIVPPSATPMPPAPTEPPISPAPPAVSPTRLPTSLPTTVRAEKLYTLGGHNDGVTGIVFLSDGVHLASVSGDLAVKLWDVRNGQEVRSLVEHEERVYNVAFSPDGTLLATASPDRSIELWEVETGQLVRTFSGHDTMVMSVAFSFDGTLVASGDDKGRIKLWGVESGQEIRTIDAHSSPVGALAFSPDGTLLASGGVEGSTAIELWDVEGGQAVRTLNGHGDNVYDLAFSSDGAQLASGSGDGTLKLWDVQSGQVVRTMRHGDRVYSVAFAPDGSLLASGAFGGTIKLWDVESGQMTHALSGHRDLVRPVTFSPDGSLLASGSFDGTVVLWRIVPAGPKSAIDVPPGNAPTLDGVISPGEWSAARRERLSDGSELLLMHHDGSLYLGIRSDVRSTTSSNVYVQRGDEVRILHASAALGTATYEKAEDGWQKTQDFVWRCRSTANSPAAQRERETFLQEEGWVGSNGRMGTLGEIEYRIEMPEGALRLAVAYRTAEPEMMYWPAGLDDDCTTAFQGAIPEKLWFSPEKWGAVRVSTSAATSTIAAPEMVLVEAGSFQMMMKRR